jgi:O-antigen/teichoic acid export membrane protein
MLLNMAITFYTSRVVLNTLGVEDFGIYGVVGGIITMFGFLNSSMAGATSRFLTFELGRQDFDKLQKTFSAALTVHFMIAVIILLLGETAGLWWLENKLVIAPERMNAARWIFHLSVIASVIGITQVPYNATIIAHERMNVYAYIEILNSLLKLAIVFLLVMCNFDKLILYAVLTLCVAIVITVIYRTYCVRHFSESRYKFEWNREIIIPMLNFSGWELYTHLAYTARTQGINILLNSFFGVIVNAAYGIAGQVQGAAKSLSNNFLTAVRPQITKYYAVDDFVNMQSLMINAAKYSFLLMFIITLPLLLETHFILQIWLKQTPDYSVVFCQIILLEGLLSAMFSVLIFAIHATGKMKIPSIVWGTNYILVVPVSYLILKAGVSPVIPFAINVLLTCTGYMYQLFILRYRIPKFSINRYLSKVFLTSLAVMVISPALPVFLRFSLDESWARLVVVTVSSVIMVALSGYLILLNKEMKKRVLLVIKRKISLK